MNEFDRDREEGKRQPFSTLLDECRVIEPAGTALGFRLFDERELSKILGCSVYWLQRKRCQGGGIPFCKIGGKVFYRADHVLSYIEQNTFSSTAEFSENKQGSK